MGVIILCMVHSFLPSLLGSNPVQVFDPVAVASLLLPVLPVTSDLFGSGSDRRQAVLVVVAAAAAPPAVAPARPAAAATAAAPPGAAGAALARPGARPEREEGN